jgi:hypothetical protein
MMSAFLLTGIDKRPSRKTASEFNSNKSKLIFIINPFILSRFLN